MRVTGQASIDAHPFLPDGGRGRVLHSDNLDVLAGLPDRLIDLVYVDPPFNTGRAQVLTRLKTARDDDGDRTGFQGQRYRTVALGRASYVDIHDDYLAFIEPRLAEIHRVLKPSGTLYFHIDYREAHYCKLLLDLIFGRACFLNEIIWAYDFGGRPRRRWPAKHDTILVYVKDVDRYYFDAEAVERIPYMAPGLVGAEKAARGKLPTDTWWHTIVPTAGKERTGYPSQKPLGILRRIVQASSPPGGLVADFFAGSGTTGAACLELGRQFLLVDNNPAAIATMRTRFLGHDGIRFDVVGSPEAAPVPDDADHATPGFPPRPLGAAPSPTEPAPPGDGPACPT
ncbi:MAG: site-specific DNA-methyltransferase [Chloroflexi bacterium]|nr:site-specific DNA-methyltransferase [Chloroflexota bacterium]